MNRYCAFFCICTFLPILTFAGAVKYKIKGQAVDSLTQKSVPFVTVTVKNQENKIVVQAASDENGAFTVNLPREISGNLTLSAIGYAASVQKFKISGSSPTVDLGKIRMVVASTSIAQVVVQAQKPLVRIEADKITYSMDSDPESQTSNALDIMRKVPLITVDGDENISLKGASNFKILLNGKESNLLSSNPKDVLKSMPASSIKNIEVITTPSSKYSAEGVGGIINIISNKRTIEGLTASVNLRADNRGGYGANIFSAGKYGKFTYSINYGHSKMKSPKNHSEYVMENLVSAPVKRTESLGNGSGDGTFNYTTTEFSYEIDSLNLLSASISGFLGNNTSDMTTSTASFDANNNLSVNYLNVNDTKNSWGSVNGGIDYQRSFTKPDKLLVVSYKIEYSPNSSSYDRRIDGMLNYATSRSKSDNDANSTENTFQIDFSNPVTKVHSYEVGAKYIIRNNPTDNSNWDYNTASGSWISNDAKNSSLNYRQDIVAAYAGYLAKISKLSVKLGARLEGAYTHSTYTQVKKSKFSSNLTDVVPYVNLSYNLSEASSLKASYTQRLQRPGIWYLNPYINDANPESISYGNPDLKTEKVHSFELGYGQFSKLFNLDVNLFTRFNENAIQSTYWVRSDGVRVSSYDNLGKTYTYGGFLYTSITPVQSISGSIYGQLEYDEYNGVSSESKSMKSEGWNYNIGGNVRWSFLTSFSVSAYGGYYSGRTSLFGKSSSFSYHGVGIRKSFFDKKLDLGVQVNNPFRYKNRWNSTTSTTEFYSRNLSENVARTVSFSLGYRFGTMGAMVKKARKSISNDDVKSGGSGGSGGSSTEGNR